MICLFWNIFYQHSALGLSTDWGFTSNLWQGLWGNVTKIYQKTKDFSGLSDTLYVRLRTFKKAVKSGGQWSILFGIHYQKIVLILCCKKLCDESHTIWLFNIAMENHHF
jgi:hypothetical protein